MLKENEVQWIVSELGELGVMIGNQRFYLYKGKSLEHNNKNMTEPKYRFVEKREFGSVCYPPELPKNGQWGGVLQKDLDEYNAQFDWISP